MSKHWNPDEEIRRWTEAEMRPPSRKAAWPEGATAGLMFVAAACLAVGLALYQAAGPREVVEEAVRR